MKTVMRFFMIAMVSIAVVSCNDAPSALEEEEVQSDQKVLKTLDLPTPEDCVSETAWGAGQRYTEQGSWATFSATTYGTGNPNFVDLIAGQNFIAGRVYFAYAGEGLVKIKILLFPCWSLQDVDEPIKIQGYDEEPSGNPKVGNFEFKDFELNDDPNNFYYWAVVPYYPFYGVHVDVNYCCD